MAWIITAAVIAADMLSKYFAAHVLSKSPVVLIKGVLELTYVENRGAAWGVFQGARIPFIIVTILFLTVFFWFYFKTKDEFNLLSKVIFALIFAGSAGNLIDRIIFGYVRDMVYFSLINFPVFNIADSAIVIGAMLLIIQTIFCKNGMFDILERHLHARKTKEIQ